MNTTSSGARRRGRPMSLEKRRAIVEAAIVEFGRRGYSDSSMDAVAARAAVSKRTLYHHFVNKETLFRTLVGEMAERIALSATIVYQPAMPLHAQLREFAEKSVALMRSPQNLKLARAIIAEHMRSPDLVEPALGTYWKGEYGFAAWVEAACADGRLAAADPVRASHIFGSIVRGTIFWPALLGRADLKSRELRAAIDEAIDMFLRYFAVGGGKRR